MKISDYFKRELYLERLRPFVDTQMIKVIAGQRRIGKSYLLYQMMDEIKTLHPDAEIMYINKELFEFDHLKNYADLVEYVHANRKQPDRKCYLFIDEIQDISEYEKALRSFFAEKDFDIYCTGSNANLLSGELASTLSGRYIEIKVHGLSYGEFLQFHRLEESEDTFARYYRFGGLPYLIHLPPNETAVSEYLLNIYHTILLKDVIARYSIRNVRLLDDLAIYLADTVGNLFSANGICKYMKAQRIDILPKTILEYLNYLINAFLVQRAKPVDLQGKNILRIGEKYYFEDLGIRHAIRPFRANDIGQVLENLVFQHLQIGGYSVAVGRNDDKEIDFVAEKAGERMYIQVATTIIEPKTAEREYGNLLKINDNYPKMVITLDNIEGATFQGIKQVPIRKFLLS
jgi:predicted AAA+ superfamily ATPase